MNRITLGAIGLVFVSLCSILHAQVPQLINYQGRVVVGPTNFTGTGQFKFALVNGSGSTTYWSNDGTSSGGSEPTSAVSIAVSNGFYSVLLGATSPIPSQTVFNNSDVRLRVWFNDGSHGSQLLSPDQRIASVGYAFLAGSAGDPSTGAMAFPNGDQLKIQGPGGIKIKTGGSGSEMTLTTEKDGNDQLLRVSDELGVDFIVPSGVNGPLQVTGGMSTDGDIFAHDMNAGADASVNGTLTANSVSAQGITAGNGGLHSPFGFFSGPIEATTGDFSGNVSAQSFSTTSDWNAKEQFRSVNAREILFQLARLPIQTWTFKKDSSGAQHIGPMAQDFYAAFQVGPDNKHIATVDADGVAFLAIQGLNEIVQEQNTELAAKAKEIDALEKRLDQIEKTLKRTPSDTVNK